MSLIEVIIASAIVLALSLVLISVNLAYLKTSKSTLEIVKATYLAEEGIETVNFLKNKDWANLGAVSTNYYLWWTGVTWVSTTTKSYIDQVYERKFFTENVNRDASSDITSGAGTLDANTRKLTVQVTWLSNGATTTKSISTYLMK